MMIPVLFAIVCILHTDAQLMTLKMQFVGDANGLKNIGYLYEKLSSILSINLSAGRRSGRNPYLGSRITYLKLLNKDLLKHSETTRIILRKSQDLMRLYSARQLRSIYA